MQSIQLTDDTLELRDSTGTLRVRFGLWNTPVSNPKPQPFKVIDGSVYVNTEMLEDFTLTTIKER
jgi:hypothetical protein